MFGLKHFRRKIRIKKGVINENISFLKIEKLKLKTQCFEFFWRWIANFIKFGVRILIIKLSKIIVNNNNTFRVNNRKYLSLEEIEKLI